MSWSLYKTNENKDEFLPPLVFSNNKTQEDIVKEVIESIKQGHKIIFIKGVCGTGKSAIALNLAKELGKASIVVPVKALQKQYEEDYVNDKFLLNNNGKKLNIKIITGRANFTCPFLKENNHLFLKTNILKENKSQSDLTKDKDSKLDDFYKFVIENPSKSENLSNSENSTKLNKSDELDISCDNLFLPCKIEIKEKNFKKIKKYLKMNPRIKSSNFNYLNQIRRMSIAPVCPYWSPLVPSEINLDILENATCKNYAGLKNKDYTIYQRKKGCGYYDQYQAYINADVIIFNSQKYKLETSMNRKPATNIEIIDECDEFLDNFSNQEKINLNRLNFALSSLFAENEITYKAIDELIKLTSEILSDKKIEESILNEDIIPIKQTKVFDILQKFLDARLMENAESDEENYCYHCDEVARIFENFLDETYLSFHKEEKNLFVNLITTNLEKRFKELLDKNKIFVMMSGTIHSEKVLKDIFGISNFKIVEAETKMPGKISKLKTGLEINCRYINFQKKIISRKQYLFALQKCIKQAEKPILVHVTSFNDLPSEQEAEGYGLDIMTREKLKDLQNIDRAGEAIKKFKSGQIKILYSTKSNRGVDFPGKTCNSIILTKYPYPNINSLFWKVLRKTRPEHYNSFYIDKSKRELLQRIYRGLRSEKDHIFLLSPDIRVFNQI